MSKPLTVRSRYTKQRKRLAILFLVPAIVLTVMFVLYPIITTVKYSFQDVRMISVNMENKPFTVKNYQKLFANSKFWDSLWKTLIFTFTGTAISFVIGMYTAVMLNKKFVGRTIARAIIMFSWPVPAIAVSIVFMWMMNADFGIFNQILKTLGLIDKYQAWLIKPGSAFWSVVAATVWKAYPFFTLMILSGLQNIPDELYEASAIDGATPFKQFCKITLPGIVSVSAVSILLNGVWFFKNFDIVYNMTGGGPARNTEFLSLKLYIEGFQYSHMGTACAIGVISLVICVLFIIASVPFMEKDFY